MIINGVFDRFKNLKDVIYHLGGMLPHFLIEQNIDLTKY